MTQTGNVATCCPWQNLSRKLLVTVFKEVIDYETDLSVCGTAKSFCQALALELFETLKPSMAIIDISLHWNWYVISGSEIWLIEQNLEVRMKNPTFNSIIGLMVVTGVGLITWSLIYNFMQSPSAGSMSPIDEDTPFGVSRPTKMKSSGYGTTQRRKRRYVYQETANKEGSEQATEGISKKEDEEEILHLGSEAETQIHSLEKNIQPENKSPRFDPDNPERQELLADLSEFLDAASMEIATAKLSNEELRRVLEFTLEIRETTIQGVIEAAKRYEQIAATSPIFRTP